MSTGEEVRKKRAFFLRQKNFAWQAKSGGWRLDSGWSAPKRRLEAGGLALAPSLQSLASGLVFDDLQDDLLLRSV